MTERRQGVCTLLFAAAAPDAALPFRFAPAALAGLLSPSASSESCSLLESSSGASAAAFFAALARFGFAESSAAFVALAFLPRGVAAAFPLPLGFFAAGSVHSSLSSSPSSSSSSSSSSLSAAAASSSPSGSGSAFSSAAASSSPSGSGSAVLTPPSPLPWGAWSTSDPSATPPPPDSMDGISEPPRSCNAKTTRSPYLGSWACCTEGFCEKASANPWCCCAPQRWPCNGARPAAAVNVTTPRSIAIPARATRLASPTVTTRSGPPDM